MSKVGAKHLIHTKYLLRVLHLYGEELLSVFCLTGSSWGKNTPHVITLLGFPLFLMASVLYGLV